MQWTGGHHRKYFRLGGNCNSKLNDCESISFDLEEEDSQMVFGKRLQSINWKVGSLFPDRSQEHMKIGKVFLSAISLRPKDFSELPPLPTRLLLALFCTQNELLTGLFTDDSNSFHIYLKLRKNLGTKPNPKIRGLVLFYILIFCVTSWKPLYLYPFSKIQDRGTYSWSSISESLTMRQTQVSIAATGAKNPNVF